MLLRPDPKGSWRRHWAVRGVCSGPRCIPPDLVPAHRGAGIPSPNGPSVTYELLGDLTAVGRKSVPNQQDVTVDAAEQVFEELDDLLGLDGLFEDLKVEVPESDAGDDRQSLPVEVKLEDRCLPSRRPRAPPMGPLAQAAFVYEDDRPALFLSFF